MESDGFHSTVVVPKIMFLIHIEVTMMSELFLPWYLSILFFGWSGQTIFTYMRWKTREMFNKKNLLLGFTIFLRLTLKPLGIHLVVGHTGAESYGTSYDCYKGRESTLGDFAITIAENELKRKY